MRDSENSASRGSGYRTPPKKKSKGWYRQCFNVEWQKDPELKDLVKADPSDKFSTMCSVCDIKLKNYNKLSLIQHKSSTKHVKNYEGKKRIVNIQSFLAKTNPKEEDIKD